MVAIIFSTCTTEDGGGGGGAIILATAVYNGRSVHDGMRRPLHM
jgi:hypothetical protein